MDWPLIKPEPAGRPFICSAEEALRTTGIKPPLASTSPPSINNPYFEPIWVPQPMLAKRLALLNGAAVAGNVDVGIYASQPASILSLDITKRTPGALLSSSGATAQAGTNQWQVFNVADVWLAPGMYFLAVGYSNIGATFLSATAFALTIFSAGGVPLPADAGFAFGTYSAHPILAVTGVA